MPQYCFLFIVLFFFATTTKNNGEFVQVSNMILDGNALLMPLSAPYGRAINGASFQYQTLLSFGGFQFATWYHNMGSQNAKIYLGRRKLPNTSWESFDTGITLINGASPWWDAHNVVCMGISAEGKIHLAYDMHANVLRYSTSVAGAATGPTWNSGILQAERNSLNKGGAALNSVTYPRFVSINNNQLLMTYRVGESGNGDIFLTRYNSSSQLWSTPVNFIDGNIDVYTDALGSSNSRNAYLNGISVAQDGTLHVTWTWREWTQGSNHDIMYAYSKDDGRTWQNNNGLVIGTAGSPIHLNSPGVTIAQLDRRQSLMNDQSQTIDPYGGLHVLMWHRRYDESGYQWQSGDPPFYPNVAAYYHYYRRPSTGQWVRRKLPTTQNVGSRAQIAADANGNLFAVFSSPKTLARYSSIYADGNLVIAGARRLSIGFSNWQVIYKDYARLYSGDPLVDRSRSVNFGILPVFIQESSTNSAATGTYLHVLEFKNQTTRRSVQASDFQAVNTSGTHHGE